MNFNITRRTMEKNSTEVSLLGFGCMRFPTKDGKIDRELSTKMLDLAMASGVNYYDTAYVYHDGESERFLGEYLKNTGKRESIYLATKLPCWNIKTKEDANRLFEEQCEKLQTNYFDFYLMHAMNGQLFDKMAELGVIEILEDYKKQGRIKNLGFSFHDGYEAFEHIIRYRDWDFCQIQYNYTDKDEQAGDRGYNLAKELGVPMVIMEPVKGGSLATLPEDIANELKKIDGDYSIASYALRWVATHDNVKVVLSGMSSLEQVTDNLSTFTDFKAFTDEQMEKIDAVAKLIKSKVKNSCTGCRYCMPCPMGVAIPYSFRLWNEYSMYNNAGHIAWEWGNLADEKKPFNCVECGKCESVCPQKISIRENLKQVQAELDALK